MSIARMTTDGDVAIYAEINRGTSESFQMDINTCYSNNRGTSSKSKAQSNGKESSSTLVRYFILASVLIILVLAATCACVIFVLVEISKLNSCCVKSDVDIASLQEQLSMFQQNVTEADASIVASLQEQLSMFQQNVSEADASIVASLARNSAELSEYRQNLSQLQLRVDLIFSCAALSPSSPSGYYWVRASNGSVVRVYCDMTLSCGGVTGGWMRVAELNMTDTSQQCPGDLMEINDNNLRRCETMNAGCHQTLYSTQNIRYAKVCGRITAYAYGSIDAFRQYYYNRSTTTINSIYVDGVSLTHGNPRQHIWTFAAALDRNDNLIGGRSSHCPCRFDVNPFDPPPFVGEDYFCDAGNEEHMFGETGLQTDPLWDGTDCLCCNSDSAPWFYKQLPQPTADDIEMRVCKDEDNTNENIAIELVNIYVQ